MKAAAGTEQDAAQTTPTTCSKIAYASAATARAAIRGMQGEHHRHSRGARGCSRRNLHAYRCPFCPGNPWHISSRAPIR